jgi:hypothetical protein
MRWTKEELETRVAALPAHIRTEIICGVAWNLFGDLDTDESEYIDSNRRAASEDLRQAEGYLRAELDMERPPVRVAKVIRGGELEIEPGHTFEEIIELSCPLLDDANTWEICGEVLVLGDDGRYYTGTVEFAMSPANAPYVEDVLKEAIDQEISDEEEEDAGDGH